MRPRQTTIADEIPCRPTTFIVGTHSVVLTKVTPAGRWSLAVDGHPGERTFETEVEAWEEGVRAADRLDTAARSAPAR